jgi:hypothetical protein
VHNEVNAEPTKDFFINMLVKDIPLISAIQDLIDNCVDGAIRIRTNDNYEGLYISIQFDDKMFLIEDNCGGFSADTARNYAFRFGRPEDAPNLPHSVGRFGVGMKRALFKMGNIFTIKSVTNESYFKLVFNVEEWKKRKEWNLEFEEVAETNQKGPFGTTIKVSSLYQSVSEQFVSETFINKLIREVRLSHEKAIEKGLRISINGYDLVPVPAELFYSEQIKPAYYEEMINDVLVRIYTGISKTGYPREAGWYIYCNGRLLVEADRTQLTGWGDGHPLYHNSYAMFRGYVFFDADNSLLLPWNTTKNGIDMDSKLYRYVRQKMINMMKPVTDFLKKIKDNPYSEDDYNDSEYEAVQSYYELLKGLPTKKISEININELSSKFQAPKLVVVRKPNTQRIQYNKPISEIEKVKSVLGVSTLKEVGERTFEYFYRLECRE